MFKLVLLFTLLPFVELWLLLLIGGRIGPGPTVGILVLTGIAGATLARLEGFKVLRDWRSALAHGRLPEAGVLQGVLVLAGALLLLTPGVLTDAVGFLLLVPASRRFVAARLRKRLVARFGLRPIARSGPRPPARERTVDVEGHTVDEQRPKGGDEP